MVESACPIPARGPPTSGRIRRWSYPLRRVAPRQAWLDCLAGPGRSAPARPTKGRRPAKSQPRKELLSQPDEESDPSARGWKLAGETAGHECLVKTSSRCFRSLQRQVDPVTESQLWRGVEWGS